MNNLLFYAILIALSYYFFFYLPQTKKLANPPLKQNRATQTEELERIITDYESEAIKCPGPQMVENNELEKLKKDNQELEIKLQDKDTSITNLQTQIRDLVKRPLKPTNSKSIQTDL